MAQPIKVEQHSSLGVLWFIGWLFSIGFLKLGFGKGVLALFIWPYFLGGHLAEQASSSAPVETVEQVSVQ